MELNTNTIVHMVNDFSRGLIGVDVQGKISIYNRKAREITGIDFDRSNTHGAGTLRDGDIVIIADNSVGGDDGDLSAEDLQLLNIHDKNIGRGGVLLCVGVYRNSRMEPVYKYMPSHQLRRPIVLETNYLGFRIRAAVDPAERRASISVNDREFVMNYFSTVGHMVAIDGSTGAIKFFQMQGYSVRKEDAAYLLRGKAFLAKESEPGDGFSVIGRPLSDIFEEGELTERVFRILWGEEDSVDDAIYEINRRPVICSLFPVRKEEDGTVDGVFLMIQNATRMEALLEDRNRLAEEVERKYNAPRPAYGKNYPQDAFKGFVGSGPLISEVKYLAYKASRTKFNVIITGESGTGKSQLAREIHDLRGGGGPFVEVNCNAIAPTLFESELFGYVGGAFTGASTGGKAGYFEAANGGTIFLDEIGEIPLAIQVKLLHVLQNKTIYRVGSSRPLKVDVRVIAATNRNLKEEVEKGTFRQDLYYRINVFPIHIPPLRERKPDLYPLINQILQRACAEYDVGAKQFSGEALRRLLSYDWPGNVRELENVIERAITLCDSELIYSEHIDIDMDPVKNVTLKDRLAAEECRILRAALQKYNGDKRQVMEELGLSKSVFYEKCKKHGLL
ncbi:sigma-54 interaction domain-containing protein [Bacilliculturomica massiliensis]|uniref:sigma-54 interaction domain-containing protein n=1 Tax=Bacilliculturomica massiliensis TaxID=1917867 RepID=UPI0010319E46|nr:sigma 54-interacting transcriptional regulator [Bacilliculturomica massiliensis]